MVNMNKAKPDDRRDNAAKIQAVISNTQDNMEKANEVIKDTDNPNTKTVLEAKNQLRDVAISGMKKEKKQEEEYNRHGD
jgi:small acid-soluble spore protein (thioredoxin-like protein)